MNNMKETKISNFINNVIKKQDLTSDQVFQITNIVFSVKKHEKFEEWIEEIIHICSNTTDHIGEDNPMYNVGYNLSKMIEDDNIKFIIRMTYYFINSGCLDVRSWGIMLVQKILHLHKLHKIGYENIIYLINEIFDTEDNDIIIPVIYEIPNLSKTEYFKDKINGWVLKGIESESPEVNIETVDQIINLETENPEVFNKYIIGWIDEGLRSECEVITKQYIYLLPKITNHKEYTNIVNKCIKLNYDETIKILATIPGSFEFKDRLSPKILKDFDVMLETATLLLQNRNDNDFDVNFDIILETLK